MFAHLHVPPGMAEYAKDLRGLAVLSAGTTQGQADAMLMAELHGEEQEGADGGHGHSGRVGVPREEEQGRPARPQNLRAVCPTRAVYCLLSVCETCSLSRFVSLFHLLALFLSQTPGRCLRLIRDVCAKDETCWGR